MLTPSVYNAPKKCARGHTSLCTLSGQHIIPPVTSTLLWFWIARLNFLGSNDQIHSVVRRQFPISYTHTFTAPGGASSAQAAEFIGKFGCKVTKFFSYFNAFVEKVFSKLKKKENRFG